MTAPLRALVRALASALARVRAALTRDRTPWRDLPDLADDPHWRARHGDKR